MMPPFLFIFDILLYMHSFITFLQYCTFIRLHWSRFFSISSLGSSVGKISLGCRAGNLTRVCLTANDALPTELRRTLLSYVAPFLSTPHPAEPRRTLLSYACNRLLKQSLIRGTWSQWAGVPAMEHSSSTNS
jgi:hypothetical protein